MSVNDSFVMNAWALDQKLENVKVIPDGNGQFTQEMGMLCQKRDKCFGERSWRYAMIVDNYVVQQMFVEPGKKDDSVEDPYGDRKSTRLNSSHLVISYAVFCLKKKQPQNRARR